MEKYWLIKNDVSPDFAYAKNVIDYYAKSFSFASKFLPENKRWATFAVYAFCRYTDNIVDEPRERPEELIQEEVQCMKKELDNSYKFGESEHPAFSAFIKSAKIFNIPSKYAYDLIKGVQMDTHKSRYRNFSDLYLFCYRVASVVGLMMTHILGFKDEKTLDYAEKMGVAMQLTNILRDVREDAQMGRIYLPQDELEDFGVKEEDIINNNFTPQFKDLIKFQVERAKKYYSDSVPGIKDLDKDSRFAIYAAGKIYGGILTKLEEVDYNPFLGRVYVPKLEKLMALVTEYFKRKTINVGS